MKRLIFLPLIAIFLAACSESGLINSENAFPVDKKLIKPEASREPQRIPKARPPIKPVTSKKICHTNAFQRPCSPEEEKMIDGINKIIETIKSFDPATFDDEFISNKNTNNPEVFIFGENHLALYGQIRSLAAINSKFKKGDILLLEGLDANQPEVTNCIYGELLTLYATEQYLKNGGTHIGWTGKEITNFERDNNLLATLLSTSPSYTYNLSGLAIKDLKCRGWDHRPSIMSGISRNTIEMRNRSMANAIKRARTRTNQVFVTTGLTHMPIGDLLLFTNKSEDFSHRSERDMSKISSDIKNKTTSDFDDYYFLTDRILEHMPDSLRKEDHLGTSKVIHHYLNDLPHGQYIHKRMLSRPYEDF